MYYTSLLSQEINHPEVFISYQWGMQSKVKALYSRLTGQGYTCWLDVQQMGGGDSLYDKIDKGIRGCKIVLCCMTPKYILSMNCRKEASLAKSLDKPMLVLLLEKTPWPAEGSMESILKDVPCIDFSGLDKDQSSLWNSVPGDKLDSKLRVITGHVYIEPEHERNDASQNRQTENRSTQETTGYSKDMSDGLSPKSSEKSIETQSSSEISCELDSKKKKSLLCVVL